MCLFSLPAQASVISSPCYSSLMAFNNKNGVRRSSLNYVLLKWSFPALVTPQLLRLNVLQPHKLYRAERV